MLQSSLERNSSILSYSTFSPGLPGIEGDDTQQLHLSVLEGLPPHHCRILSFFSTRPITANTFLITKNMLSAFPSRHKGTPCYGKRCFVNRFWDTNTGYEIRRIRDSVRPYLDGYRGAVQRGAHGRGSAINITNNIHVLPTFGYYK